MEKGLFFCFCISIIYTILSILGISNYLIHNIPNNLKKSIIIGIGLYQSLIGLNNMGLIKSGTNTLLTLGNIDGHIMIGIICLVFAIITTNIKWNFSFVFSILTATIYSFAFGYIEFPNKFFDTPKLDIYPKFSYDIWNNFNTCKLAISLLLVLLLDIGVVYMLFKIN